MGLSHEFEIVQGLRLVPSAYLMIAASFRAMDPSLEEADMDLGGRPFAVTCDITLPLIAPAMASGWLLAFMGIIMVIVQGGLIGKLSNRLGEVRLMLIGTVLDELELRGLQTGLVTLCIGGGMGVALCVEVY